jgi:hypothetical protein
MDEADDIFYGDGRLDRETGSLPERSGIYGALQRRGIGRAIVSCERWDMLGDETGPEIRVLIFAG